MKPNLRRIMLISVIVPMLVFGTAVGIRSQAIDADTDTVGVEVNWECPLLQTPQAQMALFANMGNAPFSMVQMQVFTPTPPPGPGSCPTPTPVPGGATNTPASATGTVVATETPTATGNAGGGGNIPTVPVVAQLPETGVEAKSSAGAITMLAFMAVSFVAVVVTIFSVQRADR